MNDQSLEDVHTHIQGVHLKLYFSEGPIDENRQKCEFLVPLSHKMKLELCEK